VKRRFLLANGSSLMRILAACWAVYYIFPRIVSRWTMITLRRIVQGLYRIVLSRDLLQKVCSFSADHALKREKEKWKPIFRPHPALNFWNRSR
jgi:hypothetical protein